LVPKQALQRQEEVHTYETTTTTATQRQNGRNISFVGYLILMSDANQRICFK